jgi:CRP-like cAMP-binding protein
MHMHPPFAIEVARSISRRLIETGRQVELMRGNLEERIGYLLRYCRSLGLDTERWLTNAEIARMIGATRVSVSRVINKPL